jgi:hypothetical protein
MQSQAAQAKAGGAEGDLLRPLAEVPAPTVESTQPNPALRKNGNPERAQQRPADAQPPAGKPHGTAVDTARSTDSQPH